MAYNPLTLSGTVFSVFGRVGKTARLTGVGLCFYLSQAVAGDNVMEVIRLQNRPAEEIQPLVAPLMEAGEGLSGNGFDLIVKTTPARIENLRQVIRQLDAQQHNLVISVLQNSHKTAEQLNAEAGLSISSRGVRFDGFQADTRDIERRHLAQQLRTLEGQAAHIQIGQIRQIDTAVLYAPGYGYPDNGGNSQSPSPQNGYAYPPAGGVQRQPQEASSGFAAIPRLLNDNEVVIDIAPWSERFLSNGRLANQSVQTSIKARLGEWVDIGGLAQQQQENNQGYQGFNYTTRQHDLRILLKVDLAD